MEDDFIIRKKRSTDPRLSLSKKKEPTLKGIFEANKTNKTKMVSFNIYILVLHRSSHAHSMRVIENELLTFTHKKKKNGPNTVELSLSVSGSKEAKKN